MRLLLDTHALLWFVHDEAQLSATARDAIVDPANEIFVSPASYWELAIKISVQKLILRVPFEEFLEEAISGSDFEILPILPVHAIMLAQMPFHHRDPFDRLLIAQALVEDIALISCDSVLDAYGPSRIW